MTDPSARRLAAAAALRLHLSRVVGAGVAADADLAACAARLAVGAEHLAAVHGLHFRPAYPGVSAGEERLATGRRLVLTCDALDRDGHRVGTVLTALIAGRAPQVSVAP